MNLKGYVKKIKNLLSGVLSPQLVIGGVDLRDYSLNYTVLDPSYKRLKNESIKFPIGILKNGKLEKINEFINLLSSFKNKINPSKGPTPVVLSISDYNVYTQYLNLPHIEGGREKEVVMLNLEMASPMDIDKVYYDWQFIKNNRKDKKNKILASFIEKKIVDDLNVAFSNSGFFIVAIEQRAASLARILRTYYKDSIGRDASILVDVSGDGISISIISDLGYLIFNRFVSWSEIKSDLSREIKYDEFKNIVIDETHKVINYYVNKFESSPVNMFVVSGGLEDKLTEDLKNGFIDINVGRIEVKDYKVEPGYLAAFGAALRGTYKRSKDREISLSPEGVREELSKEETLAFIKLWNEILAVLFTIILLTMLGVFVFLGNYLDSVNQKLSSMYINQNTVVLSKLKSEAKKFNKNVSLAVEATLGNKNFSEIISDIFDAAAENRVTIKLISMDSSQKSLKINAVADSEESAVSFKKKLDSIKEIGNVDLPIENVKPNPESGGIVFSVTIGRF